MENNKRGPVTIPGKRVLSENALNHWVDSTKLINESKQDRYETLFADLENEFGSINPLINLRRQRIARIIIQTERIQNVIDATFKKKSYACQYCLKAHGFLRPRKWGYRRICYEHIKYDQS